MGRHYARIAFTDSVRQQQARIGSQGSFARVAAEGRDDSRLGAAEASFITARESFYAATVSETGWPYIQHRGGPAGFVRVLDDGAALAFADLRGNRQLVSAGNLAGDDRMALFFMDYAHRRRLKLLGHAQVVPAAEAPDLAARLDPGNGAVVERVFVVRVAGHEWNCSQHIPFLVPAWAVEASMAEADARIAALSAELAALRQGAAGAD